MGPIVLTLPAVSTVNVAFGCWACPNCCAKPMDNGTTLFLCVKVCQQQTSNVRIIVFSNSDHTYRENIVLMYITVEQCPVLDFTNFTGGSMNCSHPISPNSYNSTCDFRCDEGFELFGLKQIQCDHSGKWTASVPACTGLWTYLLLTLCWNNLCEFPLHFFFSFYNALRLLIDWLLFPDT